MKKNHLVLLLALVLLGGGIVIWWQSGSSPRGAVISPGMRDEDGNVFQGNQVITGTLVVTKGGQALVDNVLVNSDYFRDQATDWQAVIAELDDKTVEVKGDLYVYFCEDFEQCVSDGQIKFLRNVEYLRIKQ